MAGPGGGRGRSLGKFGIPEISQKSRLPDPARNLGFSPRCVPARDFWVPTQMWTCPRFPILDRIGKVAPAAAVLKTLTDKKVFRTAFDDAAVARRMLSTRHAAGAPRIRPLDPPSPGSHFVATA